MSAVYWQTFTNALQLKKYNCVIIASVHFGTERDGQIYMHINDKAPSAHKDTWDIIARAKGYRERFIVGLMVGGAGGGWSTLRDNFEACMELLCDWVNSSSLIDFVDLDPESPDAVDADLVVKVADGIFLRTGAAITASPVSLPDPFWDTVRAQCRISKWHIQTYDADLWCDDYVKTLISAGWPLHKCCFGYTASTFKNASALASAIAEVKCLGIDSVIEWDP